ncbi:MAG: phosphonopyruvate decarboxylase [Cyanobacteria bacterium P01_E01_bin.42]
MRFTGRDRGFDFYVGVPCSFLKPLINYVISDSQTDYIGATSEGEAIAIAAGAWLGGRKSTVICQNSGLGNTVNPLTSLNYPFRIPLLFVTTWRGQPGLNDAPQHELMGQITGELLSLMKVPNRIFPKDPAAIHPALDEAEAAMEETALPFGFILEKDTLTPESLSQKSTPQHPVGTAEQRFLGQPVPQRIEALKTITEVVPDRAALIATTGKTGRELFTLGDRPQQFYVVGSMGGASAIALGIALQVDIPVVAIDGDGAALMKLGNFATIGFQAPGNLIHIILDNGVHDSTGGQATVSPGIDFGAIAIACGYRSARSTDDLGVFAEFLTLAVQQPGPHLIRLQIQPGSISPLGRPTITPEQLARRFRTFLINSREEKA